MMQDNTREEVRAAWAEKAADRRALAANAAANGRWFILCLVAIAIAAGELRGALIISLILGAAHVVEALPVHRRLVLPITLGIYAAAVLWLLVLAWRL
jgi:hypothetical protein